MDSQEEEDIEVLVICPNRWLFEQRALSYILIIIYLNSQLSERDWERCDALWGAVAGHDAEWCSVAAIVAMHESDRENIEAVMDPDGTGQVWDLQP